MFQIGVTSAAKSASTISFISQPDHHEYRSGTFEVRRAGPKGAPPTPLVFASPHSGRHYPEDMMSAARIPYGGYADRTHNVRYSHGVLALWTHRATQARWQAQHPPRLSRRNEGVLRREDQFVVSDAAVVLVQGQRDVLPARAAFAQELPFGMEPVAPARHPANLVIHEMSSEGFLYLRISVQRSPPMARQS